MSGKPKLVPPNITEVFSLDHEDEIKSVRFNRKGDFIAASCRNSVNLISIEKQNKTKQIHPKNSHNLTVINISCFCVCLSVQKLQQYPSGIRCSLKLVNSFA
eukprot:TRINITY_DN9392_c1_g3_i1.p3 TRINITY_DN9392_c1_g3~~TRINITY_DN9392_c1_g3_i1.p3  ORF type:complete len:102 (-),score=6.31 TRINITY_DN9392_c1_g3_i1:47-352(-)